MEYYNSNIISQKQWGAVAVAIYFVVIGVLFFTISFAPLSHEEQLEGILVQFGELDEGFGEQELLATEVATTPPPPTPPTPTDEVQTDERADVAVDSTPTPTTPQPKSVEESPEQPIDSITVEQRTVNHRALFPGRQMESSATSQGNNATSTAGNAGAQSGGDEGAAVGGGQALDGSFAVLGDRSVVGSLPKPDYLSDVTGRVIIDITVDDEGYVKSATYRSQGSTTNSSALVEAAQAAALKARFTPSENFIQGGTITYIFKLD